MNKNIKPLTNLELTHVANILNRFSSEDAMNLEMMDGFFAVLICDPETTIPSPFFPEIWGGNGAVDDVFNYDQERQEFFDLLIRHWNSVEHDLQSGKGYWPQLLEDEDGNTLANDWARGFDRGYYLTSESFLMGLDEDDPLFQKPEISFLATEHDPFFTFSNKSISPEEREKLIHAAAINIVSLYNYSADKRQEISDGEDSGSSSMSLVQEDKDFSQKPEPKAQKIDKNERETFIYHASGTEGTEDAKDAEEHSNFFARLFGSKRPIRGALGLFGDIMLATFVIVGFFVLLILFVQWNEGNREHAFAAIVPVELFFSVDESGSRNLGGTLKTKLPTDTNAGSGNNTYETINCDLNQNEYTAISNNGLYINDMRYALLSLWKPKFLGSIACAFITQPDASLSKDYKENILKFYTYENFLKGLRKHERKISG